MLQPLQNEINKDRILGLDILRCLAIVMVLIEHGMSLLKPIFDWLDFMKLAGYWGVELFFVLSGFLIGGILLKLYDSEQAFDKKVLLAFWKRRWLRTLPNYYLILILNVGFLYWNSAANGVDYYKYFFFAQNINTPHPLFFVEAWSLAIEEWFYLLFPIILFLIAKIFFAIKSSKKRFLISILILLSASLIMRYIEVTQHNPTWDSGVRKIVLLRMDAILTGVLFAWVHYYYPILFDGYKKWFTALAILLLGFSFYFYYWQLLETGMTNASFFAKTFYFNITSLGFACCLPSANGVKRGEKLSKIAWFVTLISVVSYSMYLLHLSAVLRILYQFTNLNSSVVTAIGFYIVYLFLTVVVSVVFYCGFEKRVYDLRI